jgi:hypothetical protein
MLRNWQHFGLKKNTFKISNYSKILVKSFINILREKILTLEKT